MSVFAGRTLVVATMHGKERVIAPLLEEQLGVRCVVPDGFDSDRFGTFTREVARAGDQLAAARAKARAAMQLAGADLGVASEGSFDADPLVPFLMSDLELVLLCDARSGHEIRGVHRTADTNVAGAWVTSVDEGLAFAERVGFPSHGVIPRLDEQRAEGLEKSIRTRAELRRAIRALLGRSVGGRIYLETDMRAHRNPTRMRAIQRATEALVENATAVCPSCAAPGFSVADLRRGLPCGWCGVGTDLPLEEVRRCAPCGATASQPSARFGETADPRYCSSCNP
ncbi:MAG: hypothetical protein KDD82_13035 [Planctomycetes bacterium]|nr:hypothetical protein [Planctomycetota bacterium]